MPHLSAIKTLEVHGDYLSLLAITRKAPSNYQGEIKIADAPGLTCDYHLVRALENGSWQDIRVDWYRRLNEAKKALMRQAEDVARTRDIVLKYRRG